MDFSKQKAEDWLDDLETVGTYAAEKIGDVTKNMPIVKSLGAIATNPTAQEIGSQVAYLASATNKGLQESFGGDPVDMALNYGPNAMGTIVGKSAAGWAKLPNKFSNMLDKMERAEISDVNFNIKAKYDPKYKFYEDVRTLGDLVDGPILDQYPWLKDVEVSQTAGWGSMAGERGSFSPKSGDIPARIKLTNQGLDPKKTKETLLHEIQHAIQEQEGFAGGGSPAMFNQGTEARLARDAMSFRAEMDRLPKGMDLSAKANAVIANYSKIGAMDFLPSREAIDLAMDRMGNPDAQLSQMVDLYGLNTRTSPRSPSDMYKRLGGEIESRSVASRSNIPQDQLKYSQPYGSENIPLKEWIKAEDFLDGPSMSIDRELTKEFIPRDYMGDDRYIFKIDGERVGDSLFTVQSIPKQNNPFLNFPELAGNKVGHSNLVGVEQKHQGKGIGREILKNLEGEARKKGAGYFMFTSVLPEAEGFYSKNGYVIDRTKRVAVKKIADTAEDFL